MTLNEYIKIIIKKTVFDLLSYADSDDVSEIRERTYDICGSLLYDNICANKIDLRSKLNIIFANDLQKLMIRNRNGKIDKFHLNHEFDGFIYFLCEKKLVQLGYMEEDLEAA